MTASGWVLPGLADELEKERSLTGKQDDKSDQS